MEIISRKYEEVEILFSQDFNKSLYINATQIAKHFNKQASKWLKNKDTQEYLKAISQKQNIAYGDLVVVRKGGNDKTLTGTWIHKKLIIAFARWLSPNFAVWCDIQIEDILQNGTQIFTKRTDLISVSDSELDRELKTLDFMLNKIQFSEKEKVEFINQTLEKINFQTLKNPVLKKHEPVFTLTQLLKDYQIPILTKDFNLKLQSFRIVEYSENGWEILDMRFGENRKYQGRNNPKYYKSTFQELLDIVFA